MKKPMNRKAIVISTILTALFLVAAATVALSSGLKTAAGRDAQRAAGSPDVIRVQPVPDVTPQEVLSGNQTASAPAGQDAEIAAYKAQLDQAYAALNDAYAQINALQNAQAQGGLPMGEGNEQHGRGRFVIIQGGENHND